MNELAVTKALAVVVRENKDPVIRHLEQRIAELERASGFTIGECGHAFDTRATAKCRCRRVATVCRDCQEKCSTRCCYSYFCQECDNRVTRPCGCKLCAQCAQRFCRTCNSTICPNHPHEFNMVYSPTPHDHCAHLRNCKECQDSRGPGAVIALCFAILLAGIVWIKSHYGFCLFYCGISNASTCTGKLSRNEAP